MGPSACVSAAVVCPEHIHAQRLLLSRVRDRLRDRVVWSRPSYRQRPAVGRLYIILSECMHSRLLRLPTHAGINLLTSHIFLREFGTFLQ